MKRMKQEYGVTPWGARLRDKLQSLGGRIDRGEVLARTNKVYDTHIEGSDVRARVKGRSAPYYDVSCHWEPISQEQHRTLIKAVSEDIMLMAQIIVGTLPIELLDLLEGADVRILPKSYEELHGQCNCPDNLGTGSHHRFHRATKKREGEPCKHQAGLMFQLIGEIDKNPTTLLGLRGIDLSKLFGLAKSDVANKVDYPLPLPSSDDADGVRKGKTRSKSRVPAPTTPSEKTPSAQNWTMSFPKFQSSGRLIAQSLSGPPPLFSPSLDFTEVMSLFYSWLTDKNISASVGAAQAWEETLDVDKVRPIIERASYTLVIPQSYSARLAKVYMESEMWRPVNDEGDVKRDLPMRKSASEVLGSIPFEKVDSREASSNSQTVALSIHTFRRLLLYFPGDGAVGSDSYMFFSHIVRAALLMFSSSNFVPDVLPVDKDQTGSSWTIFYRPFASNEAVRITMDRLETVYPIGNDCVRLQPRNDEGTLLQVTGSIAVIHALCITLTNLVLEIDFATAQKLGKKDARVVNCFFKNGVYTPISLQERSNGLSAKRWLSVFGLLSIRADILLRISEDMKTKNHFLMELFFKPIKSNIINGNVQAGHLISRNAIPNIMVDPRTESWNDPTGYMHRGKGEMLDTLKFIMSLNDYIPQLASLLRDGRAVIEHQMFEKFVLEKSGVLRALGILYQLPRGIKGLLRPRLVTQISSSEDGMSWQMQYLQMKSLMSFQYKVALGDELVDVEEFASMVESGRRLFQFKENYVELDAKYVDNIMKMKGKVPSIPVSNLELIRELLARENCFAMTGSVQKLVKDLQNVEETAIPESLLADLRPYQARGFQWIWNNLRKVGGCILADDMGLGKTLQTVAVLLKLKEDGGLEEEPALVISPTSVLNNWKRECQRFAPSLWVRICDNTKRRASTGTTLGDKRKRKMDSPDIMLMSYATARLGLSGLVKRSYAVVVLDEAQNIKNPTSQTAKACKAIGMKARMRIALTGTIVENRLTELHSCFEFVLPQYLGSTITFVERFSKPIERDRDEYALQLLKRLTEPFMLRRVKSDPKIISDLPGKVETKQWISLSKEQCALYESVREEVFKDIATDAPVGSGIQRRGLILKLLTALKQICDHPACYGDDSNNVDPSRSLKCMALFDILDPIIERGEKVLIFSQYVRMCRILQAQIFERFQVCPLVYEGSLTKKKRDQVLTEFESNHSQQVLILSLRAGGVGLNLTAANHVILFDRWYNPAVENQATDRAFRIGQQRRVFVHKLICSATFEEKIDKIIDDKRELAELSVKAGEKWVTDMTDAELQNLFALSAGNGNDD